jgi:hypothetical protein
MGIHYFNVQTRLQGQQSKINPRGFSGCFGEEMFSDISPG